MVNERTIGEELQVLVCGRRAPDVFPAESLSRATAHGNESVPAGIPRGVGNGFVAFDAYGASRVAKLVLPDDVDLVAVHLVASDPVFRGIAVGAIVGEIKTDHAFLGKAVDH